ncbi:hypothetical protein [Cellulomonas sp. Leaf395]|uniref:hypothetical protein n=1 Tax=Cellulomonas sp. Leaf395 TaxID=1736362 RepID=UPI0006FEF996|nr:hypothetical protein [Cellulomonas sp. Leaf395]KQT02383.1 hypothetical protein ASG23_03400 [Cellulomonas sp. Leaf395]
MKINKLTAVGATLALATASVLGLGAAANAIDVPIGSIGVEGATYPAGTWFLGNPVGPALAQDTTGLTITGQNQLLYGQTTVVETGAEFTSLIGGASVAPATGNYAFQVPVFFDGAGNAEFTTLRPAVPGTPLTTTDWISSQNVPSLGLVANAAVPFATIAAAFQAAGDAEVLAFGLFVPAGQTVVLSTVTWGGTTWNFATPTAPVVPVAPPVAPVTPAAPVATPVPGAATFTG